MPYNVETEKTGYSVLRQWIPGNFLLVLVIFKSGLSIRLGSRDRYMERSHFSEG